MIEVDAPSRLHFGLLALDPAARRQFGGVGVMIERPGLRVRLAAAATVAVRGPLADRVARHARAVLQSTELKLPLDGADIEVVSAPPEHVGLGTGTQLAFAVARGLIALGGANGVGTHTLARVLGRGRRSAIGLHGFGQGGLLVDGGKSRVDRIAPIVSRMPICLDWRFVLVIPRSMRGLHGHQETGAFDALPTLCPEQTAALCRLVLMDMLPAAIERDLDRFGEAVYELNRRVGACFAEQQGGVYAGALLTAIVKLIRDEGVRGVGQSSWGPTVFAVTRCPEDALRLCRKIRDRMDLDADEVLVSAPANEGASIESVEPASRPRAAAPKRTANRTAAH